MHRGLTANSVSHRLAMALGAVVVALAFAVALPGQASAASWSDADPRLDPSSVTACGNPITVSGRYVVTAPNGYATVKECIKYYRNNAGTYSYQGVLEVQYHQIRAADVFGGKSMSVVAGNPNATGSSDCPTKPWIDREVAWCYSPTRPFTGAGHKLYAKGYAIGYDGRWHPVWSPLITTR